MELSKFVIEMDRILVKWPENADWSLAMIGTYTGAEPEHIQLWVNHALEGAYEPESVIGRDQGHQCYLRLKDAVEKGTEISHRVPGKTDKAVEDKYQALKTQLTGLAAKKDWGRAYKNLSMFVGEFSSKLSVETQVEALGDCLRYGSKAEVSPGELVPWLKKGVTICSEDKTQQSTEEALDFIEGYGDYFIANGNRKIVETLIGGLEEFIAKFDLAHHVQEVREELSI